MNAFLWRQGGEQPTAISSVEERSRDVVMIDIFNQRYPDFPTARATGNLRKTKTRFAALILAAMLGLTVYAKLVEGSQSGVALDASSNVVTTAHNREQEGVPPAAPRQEEHGLSPKAEEVITIFGFPITNSMVVSWFVALGLIIFVQYATRNMKQVPEGAQNLLEWLVEGLHSFLEGIIGEHLTKRTFWFFATVFIFILCTNWVGLIPGIGSVGWGHRSSHGFQLDAAWLRGVFEFSPLRQHLRRRKHDGSHVQTGPRVWMVGADSFLFPGAVDGLGPSLGIHAVDGCVHSSDLSAGRRACARARLATNFGGLIKFHGMSRQRKER